MEYVKIKCRLFSRECIFFYLSGTEEEKDGMMVTSSSGNLRIPSSVPTKYSFHSDADSSYCSSSQTITCRSTKTNLLVRIDHRVSRVYLTMVSGNRALCYVMGGGGDDSLT